MCIGSMLSKDEQDLLCSLHWNIIPETGIVFTIFNSLSHKLVDLWQNTCENNWLLKYFIVHNLSPPAERGIVCKYIEEKLYAM